MQLHRATKPLERPQKYLFADALSAFGFFVSGVIGEFKKTQVLLKLLHLKAYFKLT